MRDREPRRKKESLMSTLKKGELKDCPKCRFYKNRKCDLPFPNEIETSEETKGYCYYIAFKGDKV